MKLEIPEATAFVYPDLMAVCGEVDLPEGTSDAITNPMLVIEALSASTESFDRGKKFEYYRSMTSLMPSRLPCAFPCRGFQSPH